MNLPIRTSKPSSGPIERPARLEAHRFRRRARRKLNLHVCRPDLGIPRNTFHVSSHPKTAGFRPARDRRILPARADPEGPWRAIHKTQSQISKDLAAIYELWAEKDKNKLEVLRNRELHRIEELERTYWRSFEQSQKAREVTAQEKLTAKMTRESKMIDGKRVSSVEAPGKTRLKTALRTKDQGARRQPGVPGRHHGHRFSTSPQTAVRLDYQVVSWPVLS